MKAIQLFKQRLYEKEIWEKSISLNRWDFIKEGNAVDTNLYLIEAGCVHAFFLENEMEHSMYFGFEGSLITDLSSFLTEEKSSLNIRCIKRTHAKVISKAKLNEFIQRDSEISQLWISVLSELSVWHIEREKDLLYNAPITRLQRVLLRQPQLFQKIPRKYIASYLRMSPESLSRIYKS